MRNRRRIASLFVCSLIAAPALGQTTSPSHDRPFLFSVSTSATDAPHMSVQIDSGFGERPFDLTDGDQPEQRVGVQASFGRRLTVIARVGVASSDSRIQASQQGELLYDVLHSREWQGGVALGLGVRHESNGVNVLLGRVTAGRGVSAWRVDGNAVFEKPFSTARDSVDLITTIGIARRVLPVLHIGMEVIGEDLEGFWDPNEAEGGARVLVGPSIRVGPSSARWQLSAAGGPVVHATHSSASSDATRSLPNAGGRDGFALRIGLSGAF